MTAPVPVKTRTLTPKLMAAIAGLETQARQQAIANLGSALESMSGPQKEAAILAEQIAVLGNEVDYSQTRLRAQILSKLEHGDLWRYHPSDPQSFDELVQEKGLSKSEASDLVAWEKHIYPYLEHALGLKPFQVWQLLNKTKRRRLTPYLRTLLDPDHETNSDKVRQAIIRFRQNVREALGELSPEEELKAVVEAILNTATSVTSRDLEHQLSPERTPAISATAYRQRHRVTWRFLDENTGEVVSTVCEDIVRYEVGMVLTADQLQMLRRRMPDRFDLTVIDVPPTEETRTRSTASGEIE